MLFRILTHLQQTIVTTKRGAVLALGLLVNLLLEGIVMFGQGTTGKAEISTVTQKIKTYPYDDPDRTAILGSKAFIYPYTRYDGFSYTGKDSNWTVIEMENPYIKLGILPGVGGKVKGAIEKSTGKEFIYENDVLKFRNISLRGPWSSGGIEFNFGIMGHTPSTFEKVDYIIQHNADSSVSCIVGTMDLASRMEWRVNIRLPKDKAWFETTSFFYNPTPVNQSNYVWLTAAAKTNGNLEIIYPGNEYLGHEGDVHPWPINHNRDMSFYKNNNEENNKSSHVIGSNKEWITGYWHDDDFGFGHWSRYEATPGQKIWFWSQARDGAIWEDLLTDHKGQYMEYQIGRYLAQSHIASGLNTPFNLPSIGPQSGDKWQDTWFPVKNTGGVKEASRNAVLNIVREKNRSWLKIFALANIDADLLVEVQGKIIYREPLKLLPAQSFTKEINIDTSSSLVIRTTDGSIFYKSNPDDNFFDRPSIKDTGYNESPVQKKYNDAIEYYNSRNFLKAYELLQEVLAAEPNYFDALLCLSELYYRGGQYIEGKKLATRAIENKYYHPAANYKLGILNMALNDLVGAEVAFGWAARSMEYRSAAFAQIAGIAVIQLDFNKAIEYAEKAIAANKYNINAYKTKAIAERSLKMYTKALATLQEILELDPLNHFSRFEKYLLSNNEGDLQDFNTMIRNSNPHQSYLEIASYYLNLGKTNDAIKVLGFSPAATMCYYWLAFLTKDQEGGAAGKYLAEAIKSSPTFVFPSRLEDITILQWAEKTNPGAWQTKYYLGLLYWHLGQLDKASAYFAACENKPNYDEFYLNRSKFSEIHTGKANKDDLLKAISLNATEWRGYHELIKYYNETTAYTDAEKTAEQAYKKFPLNFIIGLDHAHSLYRTGKYKKALDVLTQLNVLPYENAGEGHDIYENTYLSLAIENFKKNDLKQTLYFINKSKQYPENLGVGKPNHPDTRIQFFLEGLVYKKQGNNNHYLRAMEEVYQYSLMQEEDKHVTRYLGALAARNTGKEKEGLDLLVNGTSSEAKSWALAKYKNNNEEAKKLELEMANDDQLGIVLQIIE